MSKRFTRIGPIGATVAAAVAFFVAMPAGTANASVCDDGWVLYNTYSQNGYNATAWAMLDTLELNGCY
jgi:hypothetical protein